MKKILSATINWILILSFATFLFPEVSGAQSSVYNKIAEYQRKLNEARGQRQSYQRDVYILGLEISSAQAEIAARSDDISALKGEIKKFTGKIAETDAKILYKKSLIADAVKQLDKYRGYSIVEILVGAQSFNDFLDRVSSVLTVQKFLSKELIQIKKLKEDLESFKAQLLAKTQYLTDLNKKQQDQKEELQSSQSNKNYLVNVFRGKEASYSKRLEELYRQLASQSRSICALASNPNNWNTNKKVAKGTTIGYRGNSGFSSGPHLHFEITNKYCANLNPQSLINSGTFIRPVSGQISCGFHSPASDPYCRTHTGLDIAGPKGTAIKAGAAGTVIYRRFYPPNKSTWPGGPPTYGMYAVIKHTVSGSTYYSLYAHLSGFAF